MTTKQVAAVFEVMIGPFRRTILGLSVEMEELRRRVDELELAQTRAEQTYPPAPTAAWIRVHCSTAGAPNGVRSKLSRLPSRKRWPTRPEVEELIADLHGDPAALPDPDDLPTLVEKAA